MCLLCFQNFSFLQIMEDTLKLFIFEAYCHMIFTEFHVLIIQIKQHFWIWFVFLIGLVCHIWSPDYFKSSILTVSLFMASCQRRKVFFQLKIGRTLRLPDFLLEMYSHTHLPYSFWSYQSFRTVLKLKRSNGIFLSKKLECIIKSPLLGIKI